MQTLPATHENNSRITPNLPKKSGILSSIRSSSKRNVSNFVYLHWFHFIFFHIQFLILIFLFCLFYSKTAGSPEVEVVGSRTLSQNLENMVEQANVLYNANQVQTPSIRRVHVCPSNSYLDTSDAVKRSDSKARNSTIAGKPPMHGPRRGVAPSRYLSTDFVTLSTEFNVTKSELANCHAICSLANSSYSRLVYLISFLSIVISHLLS